MIKDIDKIMPNFLVSVYLCSIYWEELYQRRNYPQLLPSRPRIIDPANPLNNMWTSGFRTFRPHERIYDYEPGDGNAMPLRKNIHTIDLSQQDGTAK